MSRKGLVRFLRMRAGLNILAEKAQRAGIENVKVVIDKGGNKGYVRGKKRENKTLTRISPDYLQMIDSE